ncbi:uncharacterized protein LOC122089039 [Macadamia integrifolia]|uniref:uncharacterized protein LOC122089039 n=1 Tax=Macadamia integrifolia TaxID=60698 RepID=UPI001C4EEC67|nr:uncharacterized protein LOC122089039 [Macadamia integrifolia]
MGNAVPSCYKLKPKSWVRLVFWEGTIKLLAGNRVAGEVLFEYPDRIVCHAGSFYIGQPIPSLGIQDKLIEGETYFVLPIDRFASKVLSASALASFALSPNIAAPIDFDECPFQHIKEGNGRSSVRVCPEFISNILLGGGKEEFSNSRANSFLCSTPELQRHYERLVGSKGQTWAPRLDTISELQRPTIKFSQVMRLLRLERKF